ncbi:hypothetical protein [uncultured Parabacteroides sp.]|uniref:hypothetical protein n=1 Tax=uncultured Parabacteroides sp. TaxID=512312 RepID=UPI002617A40A|nr:hypothetical protein [uncultured Parabacteroides sp.]
MTENQERVERVCSIYNINGGCVQILPNATIAFQIVQQGNEAAVRTEPCITPAEPGLRESPAAPAQERPASLALFIPDEKVLRVYEARLKACPSTAILCQTVLTDLFNDVLADYSSPRTLVKSRAFISSVLPYLTFTEGANISSLRYGIRKYVLGE